MGSNQLVGAMLVGAVILGGIFFFGNLSQEVAKTNAQNLEKLTSLSDDTITQVQLKEENGDLVLQDVKTNKTLSFDIKNDVVNITIGNTQYLFNKNKKEITKIVDGENKTLILNKERTIGEAKLLYNDKDNSLSVITDNVNYIILDRNGKDINIISKWGVMGYHLESGGFRNDYLACIKVGRASHCTSFIDYKNGYFIFKDGGHDYWDTYEGYFVLKDGVRTNNNDFLIKTMDKALFKAFWSAKDGEHTFFIKGDATGKATGTIDYTKGLFKLTNFSKEELNQLSKYKINFIQYNDEYADNYLELSEAVEDNPKFTAGKDKTIEVLNYTDKERSLLALLRELILGDTEKLDELIVKPQDDLRIGINRNDINLDIQKAVISGVIWMKEGEKGKLRFEDGGRRDDKVIVAENVVINKDPNGELIVNKMVEQ